MQKVKEKRSVMEKASMARGEKSQHGGSYGDRSGKGQVHMARDRVLFWFPWEAGIGVVECAWCICKQAMGWVT